jgi:hypothetical protein
MKIGKATYIVIAFVVLLFVSAMLFFRLHIPGEAKLLVAVKQAEQQYGVDSPKVATPLSLLSTVYAMTGHPEKAIDVYRRIVAIDIKHSGIESPAVASSKLQLAILLDAADEVEQADALYVNIHKLEQRLAEITHKSETGTFKSKTTKSHKSYKPRLLPFLHARTANLKLKLENDEQDERDRDMLQRYQRRLKMLD